MAVSGNFSAWKERNDRKMAERLFLLRAFTKTYAMAGLRIGYGFCTDPGAYRADGRKLAAVERIDPGPGSWAVRLFRMSGSRS